MYLLFNKNILLGWNMGSTDFSTMVHNDELRFKFIKTSVNFLKRYKFDGLSKYYFFLILNIFLKYFSID